MRALLGIYTSMEMNWIKTTDHDIAGRPLLVTVSSHDTLLTDLEARMQRGVGFSVATLNLDHVVKLRSHAAFRQAYMEHTHVTADGNPIVWLCNLSGGKVSLVPGSELIAPTIEIAVKHRVPIAIFGATQSSLDATEAALMPEFPGINVVAKIAPPMGFDPEGDMADDYIRQLDASGAGVCFLALGAPKQEIFASRAQKKISRMGFLSIGAGLDFISNHQKRAPKIVRRFALEWLWRLVLNPRRLLGRYLGCFAILPGLIVSAIKIRARPCADPS